MRRIGRVVSTGDTLFALHGQPANAARLARYSDDDYLRLATPDVNCTTTSPQPPAGERDSFSEPTRWQVLTTPPASSSAGWTFDATDRIRTAYTCYPWGAYKLQAAVDASNLPAWRQPNESDNLICVLEREYVQGFLIEGLLIEHGHVGIGIGYWRTRCCDNPTFEMLYRALIIKNGDSISAAVPVATGDAALLELEYTGTRVYWRFQVGSLQIEYDIATTLTATPVTVGWLTHTTGECAPPAVSGATVTLQSLQTVDPPQYRFESNPLDIAGRLRVRILSPTAPSRVQLAAGNGNWQDATLQDGVYRLPADPDASEWRIGVETSDLLERIEYWVAPSGDGLIERTITPYLLVPNRYIVKLRLAHYNPEQPPLLDWGLRLLASSDPVQLVGQQLRFGDTLEIYDTPRVVYLLCDSV